MPDRKLSADERRVDSSCEYVFEPHTKREVLE